MNEAEIKAELRKQLKTWIIDNLKQVNGNNFDNALGVVDGMERVYTWLLGGDLKYDREVKAAYEELHLRLFREK